MPVETRLAKTADLDRLVELAEWHIGQTHLAGNVPFVADTTRENFRRALAATNVLFIVGEFEGAVTSFLVARVDYWVINDQPFLSEVTLVTGPEPTHASGLALLREMHKRLGEREVTQLVVSFYSGIEEEKMVALLEALGYTHAGRVMKRGC